MYDPRLGATHHIVGPEAKCKDKSTLVISLPETSSGPEWIAGDNKGPWRSQWDEERAAVPQCTGTASSGELI
ncbi:hypothetical protein EYF80_047826 [Liparis tanakae]|uniref:Uncharacterized protein n=1 Tax=Liparis tanakae TaxID=230148 RepID=A0A4Z2FNU0_9TELE|nr:hypothetical protein EYF80_047826 [Liparis tanakae]